MSARSILPLAAATLLVAVSVRGATAGDAPDGVTRSAEVPTRTAPSGTASVRPLARGQAAFLGELTLAPGAKVPAHRDPTEEIVYVQRGGGTMTMDGETFELAAGDSVVMPAGAEVSFVNGDAESVVVQVFAGPGPADKYDAWPVGE